MLYTKKLWVYFGILCVLLSIITFILKRKDFRNVLFTVFLMVAIPSFSLGSIIHINRMYDYSKPVPHTTKVVGKKFYEGKITVYELYVQSWEDKNESLRVVVSKESYNKTYKNTDIMIIEKSGLLGIKWYY